MIDDDINYMSVREFIDLGFLQEINRRVLHPAGLAMAMHAPSDDLTNQTVIKIWDYRNDPEGMIFAPGVIDVTKLNRVDEEIDKHSKARFDLMGVVIQTPNAPISPKE